MGIEIERRFLIDPRRMPLALHKEAMEISMISQAYLSKPGESMVVRIRESVIFVESTLQKVKYELTLKEKAPHLPEGVVEVNTPISEQDWFSLQGSIKGATIGKARYKLRLPEEDKIFIELDQFNERSVIGKWYVAEIEVPSLDYPVILPRWIQEGGVEITKFKGLSNLDIAFTPSNVAEKFTDLLSEKRGEV